MTETPAALQNFSTSSCFFGNLATKLKSNLQSEKWKNMFDFLWHLCYNINV